MSVHKNINQTKIKQDKQRKNIYKVGVLNVQMCKKNHFFIKIDWKTKIDKYYNIIFRKRL